MPALPEKAAAMLRHNAHFDPSHEPSFSLSKRGQAPSCSVFTSFYFLFPAPTSPCVGDVGPAKISRPSGKMIDEQAARWEPSLARKPLTVTISPGFTVSFRQPCRYNTFGGPPSSAQFTTLPSLPFTST